MVRIPKGEPTLHVWQMLLHIARRRPDGWTLIGAQMVALHGFALGREPPRPSADADVLVNTRILGDAIGEYARFLEQEGFKLVGIDRNGIGHRFRNADVSIDLLAPDGLRQETEALTTIAPARTIQIPGGTQALKRTRFVEVQAEEVSGHLPRPDLLGAILLKARAVDVDDAPKAQLVDLAFLLSLVDDPLSMAASISRSERRWLRRRIELNERNAEPWRRLPEDEADAGRGTYRILARL